MLKSGKELQESVWWQGIEKIKKPAGEAGQKYAGFISPARKDVACENLKLILQ